MRWLLVIWMFIVSAIAYLDRVNISIAGHTIMEQYHLSTVDLGWIFSAFVVGYALFQTPGAAWPITWDPLGAHGQVIGGGCSPR